jgi:hypothetical protein
MVVSVGGNSDLERKMNLEGGRSWEVGTPNQPACLNFIQVLHVTPNQPRAGGTIVQFFWVFCLAET